MATYKEIKSLMFNEIWNAVEMVKETPIYKEHFKNLADSYAKDSFDVCLDTMVVEQEIITKALIENLESHIYHFVKMRVKREAEVKEKLEKVIFDEDLDNE